MTDRGVSIAVNYVMTIMVTTMLMTGLLITVSDIVENRREPSARGELEVVGQRVAANLMTADRLAGVDGETVVVEASLPDTVAGLRYTVEVNATATDPELALETHEAEVAVTVRFDTRTPVENTTVAGGDIEVVLADDGELEVHAR